VDERVADFLADREISIGDYVLSGGEMAAAVIVEAVMRLLPGAVGNEASTQQESFTVDAKITELRWRGFDLWFEWVAGLSALHAASGISRD
jgi:tRNA G37 N-methylase TrmD